MSEIAGQTGLRGTATAVVHESYSFACMRCGHGWEQSYEIEHHTDADGQQYVRYVADGHVVPSPLRSPSCQNCDGHVLRIMRAGQVSSVRGTGARRGAPLAGPVEVPQVPVAGEGAGPAAGTPHHWHLSDLLHPFQRKAG
ncbi:MULTISPECIES: hypothetical protein [Streptomyces]|uniref:Zn finger protein HypA/HybF involved in hydrogenase expression n=1 Tax=Streptomyces murinus TaxID=33900 RepID=A0A7W3RM96_STRMR|nr:hypothetical protein [Streptomyces murinus]MBA9054134.1 Zn finger protein HypA/HybF involved in hydrogenase expression [Streptomyces murinus]UWW95180.1 hypothetical protein GO605_33375 [Streptomyces murinus]WDO07911.1 hypothetical protein ME763_20920 [Streptomyces murinus]WSI85940.1 hypothetical protein OG516_16040 [Streptomyces murinus]WUD07664.1 hypothetical protein OG586_16200 [Streptomyces murinus]